MAKKPKKDTRVKLPLGWGAANSPLGPGHWFQLTSGAVARHAEARGRQKLADRWQDEASEAAVGMTHPKDRVLMGGNPARAAYIEGMIGRLRDPLFGRAPVSLDIDLGEA
jgi:hypothetical protein